MHSITSKLNSIFGIQFLEQATASKMTAKFVGKNSSLLFEELIWRINLNMLSFSEARLWNFKQFLTFIGVELPVTFFSIGCLYFGILGLNWTAFLNAGFLHNLFTATSAVCLCSLSASFRYTFWLLFSYNRTPEKRTKWALI